MTAATELETARKRVRDLSSEMLAACQDKRLDDAGKRKRADRIHERLDVALRQASDAQRDYDAEYIAAQRRMYVGTSDPSSVDDWTQDAGLRQRSVGPVGAATTLAPLGVDHDSAELLYKSARDRLPATVKAITTAEASPALFPQRVLPPVPAAREPQRILDLLPGRGMDTGVVEYYRTTGTAAAAPVAEGAEKPESAIVYAAITARATKLAHFVTATDEALTDFPAFLGLLSGDLIAGLIDAENRELLSGTGVGASGSEGLLVVDGLAAYHQAAGDSILDAIEIASSTLRASGRFVDADAVVMHPLDFSVARRTKGGADGIYLAGDPVSAGPATLWGLRVVTTSQIARKSVLVGNFAQAAVGYIREVPSIRSDPYSLSTSNKVRVIAEERLALAVIAPSALCAVTLT